MQIVLKNNAMKLGAMAVALVVFILLSVWVARAYLATLVAERPTVDNLHAAMRLDPGDSEYALQLGRLYQYSVMDARPELALQDLRRAVRLNSYDPQAWLDLGTALELEGETEEAEACLRRVDALAPRIPQYQWAIGNFFLLHNNVTEAFRHFRMVLAGNPGYETAIYNTAWKASGNAGEILQDLVPRHAQSQLNYLNYLLANHRPPETQAVWDQIASSPEKFDAADASPYMDALIIAHEGDKAYKAWSVLRVKGLIPPTYQATDQNLVENGDFEDPPHSMGFDWRIAQVSGIYVGLDDTTFHSPAQSLLIQFPGTQNFDYRNVFQFVPVQPNRAYHLFAFMKTQGITTDSGPRVEVRDAYNPSLLDKYSSQLIGSSPAWQPVSLDFRTGPKTNLVVVSITRVASQSFDNQIAGKVWVDDVSLTLAGKEAENP